MRSSNKSRSRNKNNNRNRSMGNVVNRVFDSAGPEGKVRGTPQQIIEKYQTLARDAQLSGDRVAAENFQQHSEHYTRLLGEAQREQAEARQQQEASQRNGHDKAAHPGEGAPKPEGDALVQEQPASNGVEAEQPATNGTHALPPAADDSDGLATIDLGSAEQPALDPPLVQTPEDAPKPRARTPRRRTRAAAPKADSAEQDAQAE